MFLHNFEKNLLEIFMCLVHFVSPENFICVLVPFLVLLKNLVCSYKRVMSCPDGKFMFSYYESRPPGKFEVF